MMKRAIGVRINRTLVVSIVLVLVLIYNLVDNSQTKIVSRHPGRVDVEPLNERTLNSGELDTPFMPKMGNETLKAELGNAAWKLLHTILARYPEKPVESEKRYLSMYIESFAQVYPCGDCARHFIKLLEKYPPQLNSRKNAALWGCSIHNRVNARLGKEQYDCSNILEDYDCGCGLDEAEEGAEEDSEHLQSIRVESSEDGVGG